MSAAQHLARARALVHAGLPLPADLGAELLRLADDSMPAALVRIERDRHLCAAGQCVGGSVYAQAKAIQTEASVLLRVWPRLVADPPPPADLRGHTFAALLASPQRRIPRQRRLLEILQRVA